MSWPISKDASRSLVLGGLHSVVNSAKAEDSALPLLVAWI
jgi:hypothetical protein